MIYINLRETNHNFEKQNLVTEKDRKGLHDRLKCRQCGLEGKTRQLGVIEIGEAHKNKISCPNAPSIERIAITRCTAHGPKFANLTPGSEHDTVRPPAGYDESRGVWVMGVGEPVLVLFGEFRPIKE